MFCTGCGRENARGLGFCTGCGKHFVGGMPNNKPIPPVVDKPLPPTPPEEPSGERKLRKSVIVLGVLILIGIAVFIAYSFELFPFQSNGNNDTSYSDSTVGETDEPPESTPEATPEIIPEPVTPSPHPFIDVADTQWYAPYVQTVYERGITQGVADTLFAPAASFDRAQVAAALFRLHHDRQADISDPRGTPFDDVGDREWYAPYIAWAYEHDIVTGISGRRFAPSDLVTREQLAVMLHRFASFMDYDTDVRQSTQWSDFIDHDEISTWAGAEDALIWANYHSIITGNPNATIDPDGSAVRAEAAAILVRFIAAFETF